MVRCVALVSSLWFGLLASCGGSVGSEPSKVKGGPDAPCRGDDECAAGLKCRLTVGSASGEGACTTTVEGDPHEAALDAVGALGYSCDEQNGCKNGLECLRPAGTVASGPGTCSLGCDASAARTECEEKHQGTCVTFRAGHFCEPPCKSSPPACAGATCGSVDGRDVCRATCSSDQECPVACDLALGECVEEVAVGGAPVGAVCTAAEQCVTGVCAEVCTADCTLGQTSGCGSDMIYLLEVGGPMCYPIDPDNYQVGRRGTCVQDCNSQADCTNPDARCEPLSEQLYQVLGILHGATGRCVQ